MNNKDEINIEKWYESKVVFIVSVLTPIVAILFFVLGMKTDIALIQHDISNINTNHETHIQDIVGQIKEMKQQHEEQDKQIIELQKQVLVILKSIR